MPASITSDGVRDPSRSAQRYARLREQELRIRDHGDWYMIQGANRDLILALLGDMEQGVNVGPGTPRGPRGFQHLLSCRHRLCKLALLVEKQYGKNFAQLTEYEVAKLFNDMRSGVILKSNGAPYKSTGDYVKMFKILWRWYVRVQRKHYQKEIPDITVDLDMRYEHKPPFVYFTMDKLRQLANHANFQYRVLMWFLFDSGIRAPTELLNVKVSDITPLAGGEVELRIREETAKTFGRRIKLLLSGPLVLEWIRERGLGADDFLFTFRPHSANRYLQRLALRVFGDKVTLGRDSWAKLSMYDFRHSSCCYWLPRYKSESALKYRFGWKKSEQVHYYSELLGMRDTISQADLLDPDTTTKLEGSLTAAQKENALLREQLDALKGQAETLGSAAQARLPYDEIMTRLVRARPEVFRALLVEMRAAPSECDLKQRLPTFENGTVRVQPIAPRDARDAGYRLSRSLRESA